MERFLKAKGENVKKAVKSLRACLSWRDSIGIGTFSFFFSFILNLRILLFFFFLLGYINVLK